MSRIVSLRWKIVAAVATSLVLALAGVTVLVQIAYRLGIQDRSGPLYAFLNSLRREVGVGPSSAAVTLALFVSVFYLLSRSGIRYLGTISRALQQVSLGRLDIEIPPRGHDELGELGANINRMTERLKASLEEERRAEEARHELIASVSHDLKTPLTSILGYLELIGKPTVTDVEEARRYGDIALQKARQLAKLTDDLFEYAKVSHGALVMHPSRIDLKALLVQLAEEYVPVLQDNGMEYRLEAQEGRYIVLADGDLMVRVFENLMSNAMRHGREGRVVELGLSGTADQVVARVVNYGDPIPPEALPRVFDRFYRADASRNRKTGGAGLGLAIAQRIVELHGGEIAVRSDRIRTVFEVTLRREPDRPGPA